MRTGFNGFGDVLNVIVGDEPMATLYGTDEERPAASNVVQL
jgi:hypothetical protein